MAYEYRIFVPLTSFPHLSSTLTKLFGHQNVPVPVLTPAARSDIYYHVTATPQITSCSVGVKQRGGKELEIKVRERVIPGVYLVEKWYKDKLKSKYLSHTQVGINSFLTKGGYISMHSSIELNRTSVNIQKQRSSCQISGCLITLDSIQVTLLQGGTFVSIADDKWVSLSIESENPVAVQQVLEGMRAGDLERAVKGEGRGGGVVGGYPSFVDYIINHCVPGGAGGVGGAVGKRDGA
jgi:hypothetical protein